MYTKLFSSLALLVIPGVARGLIETCEDLQAAFELTQTQDVVDEISTFGDIECPMFTNMTMTSNTLTLNSAEDLSITSGSTSLINVRLEVTNGAKLVWETSVFFLGDEEVENNVNGGGVFVGEGSTVRFLNDVQIRDVRITNERDGDSDNAVFVRDGGCVWTAGFFRVDGEATFTSCAIIGTGESPPGSGGAVFVDATGSVLFNQGVAISDTFITNDGGGDGGGIFNLGKVNIKGDSRFEELSARSGAAIFNGEDASFNFRNGASAFFRDLSNRDSEGSALVNLGFFKFSGPVLFVDAEAPVIVATEGSTTIISRDSAFWMFENDDVTGEAISVADSAEVSIPGSVSFVGF
ncbi:hypothetical protein Esi_0417_0002 [Ectocarpus siliculosus]|uniref:Uncharacterized protein n=1 Tax=Ectocarpus siliculosus TaxID=2880 RepID=D7G0Q4_ECTSI|nr:hypothetical protein Esi_0417_0002 [Ectocarpus siliculosus]|eukprot:CBJ33083.1 hypothetical protein Esi_0417_0002 [Ectocarpus siliculosus]